MRNRRTAVLGGSGFIGRYVVKRLAERGEVVTVGGRHAEEAKFLMTMGDVGQVGRSTSRSTTRAMLPAFLAGKDALINCVGILAGARRADLRASCTIWRRRGWRGWRARPGSSGSSTSRRSAPTRARPRPMRGPRRRASRRCATRFRPRRSCGRRSCSGRRTSFFNRFAAMAMISPVVPLIGGGETRFQPVYVGDVADAVIACLDDPATAGRTYELGGPKIYTFRELIELLLAEIRRKRLLIDLPFGAGRAAGAADVDPAEPAADRRPGRDAEARQRRLLGALDPRRRSASSRPRSRRSCRAISTASAAAAGTRRRA